MLHKKHLRSCLFWIAAWRTGSPWWLGRHSSGSGSQLQWQQHEDSCSHLGGLSSRQIETKNIRTWTLIVPPLAVYFFQVGFLSYRFYNFPNQLRTKCSNTWVYEGHSTFKQQYSFSDQSSDLPLSLLAVPLIWVPFEKSHLMSLSGMKT